MDKEIKRVVQKVSFWFVTALGALVILGIAVWLAWLGMLAVSPNAARAWALIATALLPFVAWASWYFGRTEARGRLAGIDQAVDKVMGAATRAASLRVGTSRAMRHAQGAERADPPIVVLPDVEIIPRQLPASDRVIDL